MEDAISPDPSRLTDLAEQLDRLMAAPTGKPTLVHLDVMGIGWPIHVFFAWPGSTTTSSA
ncbi:MAG: hypothetical protein CL931_02075 [Deltaproteobacteria bacterium]|nr:hypothetical protein [Deltaproteobacteria bacterium]